MSDSNETSWVEPWEGRDEPWEMEEDSVGWWIFEGKLGAFIFFVAGIFALTLLMLLFIRDFYVRNQGARICRIFTTRTALQREEDLLRDRAMAEELQRQLNQEDREAERQAKRRDRRKWYEEYIKPYTAVSSRPVFACLFLLKEQVISHVLFSLVDGGRGRLFLCP